MMNVLGWSLYKYKGPKRHITENLERFGEPTVEHYDRKGSFMTRLCGVGNSFDHHEPANHVITFKSGEKTVTIGLCHEHAQHLANDLHGSSCSAVLSTSSSTLASWGSRTRRDR